MAYLLTKTFHLVFVIAWMAAVFYLPRILVNLAEAGESQEVRARLLLMGRRLYRFGHVMFGIAFVLGLVLWLGYRVLPAFPTMVGAGTAWLHAKLGEEAISNVVSALEQQLEEQRNPSRAQGTPWN